MSDVKLTVGVNEELSFRDFDSSIKKIINKVNNQNYKIKIDLSDESLKDFRNQINEIAKSIKNIGSSANAANGFGNIKSTLKDVSNDYDKVIAKAEKAKASFSSKKFKGYSQISAKQSEYEAAHFKAMENLSNGVASQTEIANVARLRNELNKLVESYLAVNKASGKSKSSSGSMTDNQKTSALTSIDAEIARLESKKVKYSAAKYGESSKYYAVYDQEIEKLKTLRTQVEAGTKSQNSFNRALRDSKNASKEASDNIARLGKNHESLGDRFKGFAKHFSNWVSTSRAYRFIEQTARKMLTSVLEIDAAMTELKKVTDETEETYNAFLDRAADRAKKLGATLKDTISSSADMARLGFDLDDASTLADTALVYKNVGDGISDINEASSSIISTMQAFGVEAENSMQIVDKFNTAGNNFAISSGGVGDALLNSASALAAAGNSLDESIAMITAANTVVQDPQKVGTSMKTISMYLRAAKTDAEAAGESTDGMADSVSKLRAEILQLTGGQVDIQIDENNFKSTYQIMKDLSEVWSSLSDISQANILERIGGKRNANITAALLENFELVDKVIDKTSDSTGSALAENEKYLDSVNGKIAQFKASFEELSTEVLDSDILKIIIDAGNIGLETVNAVVGGLKSIVGSLTDLGIGLEYIIPLLGLKFFGAFDDLKDFANDAFGKVGNFLGKLKDLAGTTDHTISGILKGWGNKIGKFFTTGFGKATIAIAAISALVSAYKYLSEAAERSRQKLQEISDEYNDNTEQLKTLNSELDKTRLRMYELLNSDTLTYVEQTELDKLKESNSELEKEIELLRQRNNILEKESHSNFLKTGKNTFDNGFTAFNGLTLEEWFESTINRLLNYDSGFGDNDFNLDDGIDFTDILVERLSWYNTKLKEFQEAKENYYKASIESDREHFQESMEQARENYGEAESYIVSVINTLQTDLNSLSGYEYGTDPILDKEIDRYNKWIEKLKIGLGYDEAKDSSFSRHITQTFDDVTDAFEDLGKEGKVTAKIIEEAYDNGNGVLGDFINSLIDVGYISGSTNSDLARVASAFNSLGEEAQDAGDYVEDAFKRWENAQDAVQSGAKFDSFKEAMELVYDTVSDKSSELYAKVGNENYKAAIELIVPEWKNIDSSDMSAVEKYQKEIKKFFTFDENGEYKGLNVKAFSQKALEAGLVDYDKVTKTYKIKGKQTLESFAQGMGLSVPAIKAIIGEINEYGGDIQLYEYNKDIVSLAQEAKNAAASLEESFGDLDIELDLAMIVDPIVYIEEKIAELNEKRVAPEVDTTSFNNYTKIMEYYIRQKQLLEKPAILMLDTTQITDPSALAAINTLIKFTNIKREIDVKATLGHDTSELEKDLEELTKDINKSYKNGKGISLLGFDFDKKSKKDFSQQVNDFVNGLSEKDLEDLEIGITPESFKPAMDAVETIATKVNEIFSSKRVLTFDWTKEDGVWKLKINTEDVDNANKKTEETSQNINEITDDNRINIESTPATENTYKSVSELLGNLVGATIKDWIVKVKMKFSDEDESDDGGIPDVTDPVSGIHGVNGTAHAKGNWGFEGGEALVGELGQEIVVDPKTSSWYTVGDHGAEFVDIPKNAIIFNHRQTESLLKNGYVTGRGHALVGGTALNLEGEWQDVPIEDVNNQGKKSKDSNQIIDYIEILLSRLSRSLENFAKVADDTSKSFKERNKALEKQINKTDDLITANQNAADAYLKKANSISLSSGIKEKVRHGSYNITEYDSDTAEKINKYKEYYEKYLEAKDEVDNQKSNKAALAMEQFSLIQSKYDSKFDLQDAKNDYYENLDEQAELDGKGGSIKAQNNLINIQERRKNLLEEEHKELEAMMNSGTIKKGTEDWYEMQTAIQQVKSDIIATDNEIKELENRKVEIQYERFENTAEKYDNELALRDNRISLQEAKNNRAELQGKGGSINAQKEIISINEERAEILKQERDELRKQVKNIKEGTPEWYKAKEKIQEINIDLVETDNAILEAKDNINAINLDRFNNVSESYESKHSETNSMIAYYEDLDTTERLNGNYGSLYAQDMMIQWNLEYIENLKAEEKELRDKLNDINKDSPEYQQALDTLRDHLDKIRDAENQQIEYLNNKRDILSARFNDIQTQYDNLIGDIDMDMSRLEHKINTIEATGHRLTESHYQQQIEIETRRLGLIREKYAAMKEAFDNAVETGEIKEGSLEWYEYKNALDAVEQSGYDTELTITKLTESIKDLDWENFKRMREEIEELNDEADFYLSLLSNKKMYDSNGSITQYGTSALGLHAQKYNTYLSEVDTLTEKLEEVDEKLKGDPENEKLIEQKKELKDAIQDNILAAEDEKQAMVDLVEEGINTEIEALQRLVDEYKNALDKAKDLHDYEKKISDSTSDISSIKKQLSAYSGDDSQESKAKIQKLQADLKKAEDELKETEYDKYISDQKDLLDEFYNEYEENLNSKMEDVEGIVSEVIASVNSNSSTINDTLEGIAEEFGVVMSEEMKKIWGSDTFGDVMSDYLGEDSDFSKFQTTVSDVLKSIFDKVSEIFNYSKNNDNSSNDTTVNNQNNTNDSISSGAQTETDTTGYKLNDRIKVDGDGKIMVYGQPDESSLRFQIDTSKGEYYVKKISGDWIGIDDASDNGLNIDWIKSTNKQISKYKKGGLVDYTGLAWVDGTKSNPEYVLNAEDTKNLITLTEDIRKLYALKPDGLMESCDSIFSNIVNSGVITDINRSISSTGSGIGEININIPIEKVQDYNDFVTQLRDDPKFDKFIKSISLDLLDGKSRLAKNKIYWNK